MVKKLLLTVWWVKNLYLGTRPKKYFPQVRLTENKNNLGFAKANNQALKLIKNKYALLLNPDMKLREDTLQNIYNWMENNKQVSVAGIKLLGEDGGIIKHVRKFPKFFDQLAIILKFPHVFPQILNKYILNPNRALGSSREPD